MKEDMNKLNELEQEVLAFIRKRESSRNADNEFSKLSDELSDIAETWNTLELLDNEALANHVSQSELQQATEPDNSASTKNETATSQASALQLLWSKLQPYLMPATISLAATTLCLFGLMTAYYGVPTDYSIAPGKHLAVTLKDGTAVLLYSGTEATITEGWGQRKTELRKGTAFFTVSKNANKPFRVISGDTSVTVLGTQFSVYHDNIVTEVIVKEGKVNVKNHLHGSSKPVDEILVKNNKIRLSSDHSVELLKKIDIEDELSWQKGVINFKNEQLSSIVARMNHYYKKPIYIASKELEAIRLSGSFTVGDKQSFIKSITELKRVQVKEENHNTVLY